MGSRIKARGADAGVSGVGEVDAQDAGLRLRGLGEWAALESAAPFATIDGEAGRIDRCAAPRHGVAVLAHGEFGPRELSTC